MSDRPHKVPGTDLTYRVKGEGKDLVLAHGLGGLFHSWSKIMPLLAGTHRVWEVGFPDFDSATTQARGGNSVEDYAADLGKFVDHVELKEAVVIGNSLGGQVATTFANQRPTRVPGLVLLSSSGLGEQREGYSLFKGDAVKKLVKKIDPDVMRAILRTVFENDADFEEQLPVIRERLSDRKWKLGLLTTARRVRDACVLPLLPHIACPTLMLYGDQDRITPVRYAREAAPLLPKGELAILDGVGHAPQIERPEDTHRIVGAFLTRIGWA
jgi:pimeloyl-ACP methyl ester carboxylesterase